MKSNNHNELEHLKSISDLTHPNLNCFGVDKQFALKLLSALEPFKATNVANKKSNGPDMKAMLGPTTYGIEHFQYDASPKYDNGSAEQIKISSKDKEFKKKVLPYISPGEVKTETYKLSTKASLKSFKENFIKNLEKHSKKIPSYKKNIKTKKIWFLAEDTSCIPPIVGTNFGSNLQEYPLLPAFLEDIEGILLKIPIEGIIFISTYPIKNFIVFIKNNHKSYANLRKKYQFSSTNKMPIQFNDNATMTMVCTAIFEEFPCYNKAKIGEFLKMDKPIITETTKICQSCAMPLTSPDLYGTNKNGTPNEDYCKWCYDKGEFLDDCTMEEYIEKCSQFGEQAGMTNEEMHEYCTKVFPTLKRWKKA